MMLNLPLGVAVRRIVTTNNVGFFSSYELHKERADIYPTPHQRTNVAQGCF